MLNFAEIKENVNKLGEGWAEEGEHKEEKVEKILEIDNKKCFLQFSQLIRKKVATNWKKASTFYKLISALGKMSF